MTQQKVVAIVSGGLDSITLVHHLLSENYEVDLVSFDYGQRHKKELQFARGCAKTYNLRHDIVDLTCMTHLISNSALTNRGMSIDTDNIAHPDIEVPEGHYAEENMKQTVVPNRNMIMFAIAAGAAINRGADFIAAAQHSGDHFIYPDCRPRFIAAANAAIVIGNEGFGKIGEQHPATVPSQFIMVPFLHQTKADIAYRALQLEVPLHMTWSCYKGGSKHCGRCGTCVERLEAIHEALTKYNEKDPGNPYRAPEVGGRHDFTEYEDTEYWKQAVREAKEKVNG